MRVSDKDDVPTSIRRLQVINWKSMCIVLCCIQCVEMYSHLIPDKGHNFFLFEQTAAESYRLLREAYGENT